ncbi:ferredoxin [Candidatus Bathyarchaeota archaeon]|nr:ferredoxin [Candidatus Bathyarchaeota archaeon]
MGKQETIILIDYAKCPPCTGLICIGVCPLGVLEAGANGKPQIADIISCTRCEVCSSLCPSKAIIINQERLKDQ